MSFTIGKEGITIKNKLYSFDDISTIGCRTPSGVIAHSGLSFRGNAQAVATAAISRVSCNIYMVHGTKEIPIIPVGLTEHEAEHLYKEILKTCEKVGVPFSQGATN